MRRCASIVIVALVLLCGLASGQIFGSRVCLTQSAKNCYSKIQRGSAAMACDYWKCITQNCPTYSFARSLQTASCKGQMSSLIPYFKEIDRSCVTLHDCNDEEHIVWKEPVLDPLTEKAHAVSIHIHHHDQMQCQVPRCYRGVEEPFESISNMEVHTSPRSVGVTLRDRVSGEPQTVVEIRPVADAGSQVLNKTVQYTITDITTGRKAQFTPFFDDAKNEMTVYIRIIDANGHVTTRHATPAALAGHPDLKWVLDALHTLKTRMEELGSSHVPAASLTHVPFMKTFWGDKCGWVVWGGTLAGCGASVAGCAAIETGAGAVVCIGGGVQCASGIWCCLGGSGC